MVFKKNPNRHLVSVLICAMVAIPVVCWPIGIGNTMKPSVLVRRAYSFAFPEDKEENEAPDEEWALDPALLNAAVEASADAGDLKLTEDGLIDVSQGGVAQATYLDGTQVEFEPASAKTIYSDVPTFTIVQQYDDADLPIELLDTEFFAPDDKQYYIAADNSIIKETPDMSSITLSKIAKGTGIKRIGIGDTWSKIRTESGTEGSVLTNTLSIEPVHIAIDRTVWVDCDSLSLREEPSTEGAYIGSLSRDTRLRCVEIVDKWFKVITPNGTEGYVYTSLTTETPPPTPTPVPTRRPANSSSSGSRSGSGSGSSNNKTGKVADLPAISGCNGQSIVDICVAMLGVDYVWAGESSSGVDCSGLVVFAYRQVGISVPHLAQSITGCGINVAREDIAPGDVVCWNTGGGYCGHVGIYVGGGQVSHASNSRDKVCYGSVDMMPIVTIRRLIQ